MICIYTVSEFTHGRCETDIQNISKMFGQNFRTEFQTPKVGEEFISTYVCKLLDTTPLFDRYRFFRFIFIIIIIIINRNLDVPQ
jgi:hypothetical protein